MVIGNEKGVKYLPGRVLRLGGRIFARLFALWLFIHLTGPVITDARVRASEAGAEAALPAESPRLNILSPARIVPTARGEVLTVVRKRVERAGSLTMVTGFDCQHTPRACDQVWTGRYQEAVALFRGRIDAGEDGPWLRCGLANSLLLAGDLPGATRAYHWAEAGFPGHPDVRNGLGNVFVELHKISEAGAQFRLLAKVPGYAAVAFNNLGNALRVADRASLALAAYRQAAEYDPRQVAPAFNRAATQMNLQRFDEAGRSFRVAAALSSRFTDTYLFEGLAHLRAGKPVSAAVALFRARDLGLDSHIMYLALGVACQEAGLDQEAIEHLERARSLNPHDADVYNLLSVSLVRNGELARAAEILERGFVYGSQDANAHFFIGLKLFLCEKPVEAARHFIRSAAMGRREADTYFALGQSLLQAGEVKSAIHALETAARITPQAPEVHFALGVALVYEGQIDKAVQELETSSALDPEDSDTLLVLMDLLRKKGDFKACARTGRAVVSGNPDLVAARFDTALCHALAKDMDRAAEAMEDALDHDIEGVKVLQIWKQLTKMNDSENAEPGPYLLLGMIHERRGNWSQAVRAFEKFIRLAPSQPWTQKAVEKIHQLIPRELTTCPTCRAAP